MIKDFATHIVFFIASLCGLVWWWLAVLRTKYEMRRKHKYNPYYHDPYNKACNCLLCQVRRRDGRGGTKNSP